MYLNGQKLYHTTKSKSARCVDQETLCAVVDIPALRIQILLLVHHGVDGVTLNGKAWVICRSIHAHVVALHVPVRGGQLHGRVTYDLRPPL
jgi:hypothetical protein